ncbi:MAG: PDZ domain-containing protein [Firmicutes bacterium]|nr:PDZ domain-containing protein [Dethiobacter sp.]MBS3888158.1 PDZ domain-containing protein [Bacillota bacterium]MBS4054344.1 PDZ domain-containing protein [Thermaerobacter sp.]
MPPFLAFASAYLRALPQHLTAPWFYVVLILIALQYRRTASLERRFWGREKQSVLWHMLVSLLFGVLGGILGSILLLSVGVTLAGNWLVYTWVVAIILAFVSARLMCFAYAGGLVALSSLLFGWPKVDIPSLLALVALLHTVESILMYLSGHLGAIAVSVRTSRGDIVAGYSLQKFWPVPLLALMALPLAMPAGVPTIPMPDWWPLIRPQGLGDTFSFWMIPIVAGLGYGELAITTTPQQKARQSAWKLALYSGVLFALAFLATRFSVFLYIAALFAPIGHELLVWTTNRQEMNGRPLLSVSPDTDVFLEARFTSPLDYLAKLWGR